jgi:NAD(P)-dependent dehydrogenase (short-subunit alcohol dehydrogenase family)
MTPPGRLFDLGGRVCLVTGAGRGIGREAALAFAAADARVVAGDVDAAAAKDTAEAIGAQGGRGPGLALDVADPRSVALGVEEAARFGGDRLDVLVNNAGVNVVKPTDELTLEEWQRVLSVNLTGVFLCSQAASRGPDRGSASSGGDPGRDHAPHLHPGMAARMGADRPHLHPRSCSP